MPILKQLWALAMLLVLAAVSLGACELHERRCREGHHWNGSFCEENRGEHHEREHERVCPQGTHWNGNGCVDNVRERTVGRRTTRRW